MSAALAEVWHPEAEDEAWLIEEVAAEVAIADRSTSHACWHPRTVWEPVIRAGLGRLAYVKVGTRQLAWAGGLAISERWPDGYAATRPATAPELRRLLKSAALVAARNPAGAKVSYQITTGGKR